MALLIADVPSFAPPLIDLVAPPTLSAVNEQPSGKHSTRESTTSHLSLTMLIIPLPATFHGLQLAVHILLRQQCLSNQGQIAQLVQAFDLLVGATCSTLVSVTLIDFYFYVPLT